MASTAATTSVTTPAQTIAPATVTAAATTTSAAPIPAARATVAPAPNPTSSATQLSAQTTVVTAVSTQPTLVSAQTTAAASQSNVTSTATSTQQSVTSATSVVTASVTQPIVTSQSTGTPAQSSVSAGFGQMSTKDMETLYETPWRRMTDWRNCFETKADLLDTMENYEPLGDLLTDEVQFPVVNILLFGSVGAGKSSVFNTINSVFRGKIFNVARSGCSEHSLTTKFTKYPVMSSGRTIPSPLKFRICDIRGLEHDHLMSKENMRLLLEGHVGDRFPFDPSGNLSADMPGFKKYPELHEKIHCVAIVQDATIVDVLQSLDADVNKNIKDMQVVMNSLDIPQVVLLTKIDSVCEKTKSNISDAFYSPKVERCVSKAAEVLGLPRMSIFPIKNYETECQLDPVIDTLTLLTFKKILDNCDAHLFSHYQDIQKMYSIENKRKP